MARYLRGVFFAIRSKMESQSEVNIQLRKVDFEVEKIVDMNGVNLYEVKWKGYNKKSDNTWLRR